MLACRVRFVLSWRRLLRCSPRACSGTPSCWSPAPCSYRGAAPLPSSPASARICDPGGESWPRLGCPARCRSATAVHPSPSASARIPARLNSDLTSPESRGKDSMPGLPAVVSLDAVQPEYHLPARGRCFVAHHGNGGSARTVGALAQHPAERHCRARSISLPSSEVLRRKLPLPI
jgi:hypothetical protein